MTPASPLTELKGVGAALAAKFAVLGIKTIGDLLDYYPRRYEH
jgi:RecG-like helicase